MNEMVIFSIVVTSLVALITGYLYIKHVQRTNEYVKRNVKYVNVTNIFAAAIRKQRMELIKDNVIKQEGKVFGFDMLGSFTIMVAEPELIQLIFNKQFTNFVNRRPISMPDKFLSYQMSVASGDTWKRLRSVVSPAFSAGKIRRMKPSIDNACRNLIKNFDQNIPMGEIKRLAGAFTMDTILQVAFGVKVDSLTEGDSPLVVNTRKLFSQDLSIKSILLFLIIFTMPTVAKSLNLRYKGNIVDFFVEFATEIIKQKRELYKKNIEQIGKANNFIELLIEAEEEAKAMKDREETDHKIHKYITDDEMIAQCIMFFVVGYDPTATLISIVCYVLATNTDKQDKLYQEIQEHLKKLTEDNPNTDDPYELITFDALTQMPYLSAVINETLRMYPPGLFSERCASTDMRLETSDGNVRIDVKKDDIIHIPIWSLHHCAEYFPEPEMFQPERFIGEPSFPKFAYLPFGSGPRNCVGKYLALLEAKVALFHIVRNFHLNTCPQTMVPLKFYNFSNILTPQDIVLRIDKRM